MDEEEELENTLIGQEEAPDVDTGDALMGKPSFLPYADDVAPSRVNALSVFTPGGDLKPSMDVNAITSSPTTLPDPSAVNTALNQEVAVGLPEMSTETTSVAPKSALLEMLERADERERMGLPRQAAPGIIDAPSPVVDPFTGQTIESPTPFNANNSLPAGMTMGQAAIMKALPDQNQGMDMNQQAISNAQIQGVTQGQETTQGQEATAPSLDQTLSQFMRNEDAPEQRTEQFVDPQGRLRRRLTPEASALQGFAPGVQPLAPEYTDFERESLARQQRIGGTGSFAGDSAAREARLRANERQPGESQAAADTRVAQSRTTGGQTEGLSFDDARRRAEGQLAARGVRNPSASDINSLARAIQAAEPERLAELETKRAKDAADLRDAEAKKDFKPQVVEIGGQKLIQLSPNYYQPVRPEPTAEEPFEPRVLEEGGFTYYEVAPNRFERQPKDTTSTTEETSGLIPMDGEDSVATETTPIVPNDIKDYPSVEAAEAANLPLGTRITVQGKPAIIE